jgi:amidase
VADLNQKPLYGNAFISLLWDDAPGLRVGVKDVIDVTGTVTTAGCAVVAEEKEAATADAACLAGVRAAGASIVGKTNLSELAFGATGTNAWSGTPVNPLGNSLVPGGSSSGSAVAVALGACEVALGTDTGGSVRIPSACCGTMALKTTQGQIPMQGVSPLAPTLDTVGPMAAKVESLALGARLLIPSIDVTVSAETRAAVLRFSGVSAVVQAAVEECLAQAGFTFSECSITEVEWEAAFAATNDILWAEAAMSNLRLRSRWRELQNGENLELALEISKDKRRLRAARQIQRAWRSRLAKAVDLSGLIASPTIGVLPPTMDQIRRKQVRLARFTNPVNLAGLPAVVMPTRNVHGLPASLQLIGPASSEAVLLASAAQIEWSCLQSGSTWTGEVPR